MTRRLKVHRLLASDCCNDGVCVDSGDHVLAGQEEERKEVSGFAFSTLQ